MAPFFGAILISIIISIAAAASVSAQDPEAQERYRNCSRAVRCGEFRIEYPFWGINRPSYCGHPGFNLSCSSDQVPIIAISDLTYQVLRVNVEGAAAGIFFPVVTLARTDDYEQYLCPAQVPLNANFNSDLFKLGPGTELLTIHYGCPQSSANGTHELQPSLGQFSCRNGLGDYFVTNGSEIGGYEPAIRSLLGSCGNRVTVPASGPAVASASWREAIGQSFGLRWHADDVACETCQNSGGQCGFNEVLDSFACLCADRTYALECQVGVLGATPAGKTFDQIAPAEEGKNRVLILLKILVPVAASITLLGILLCYIRSRALKKKQKGAKLPRSSIAHFGGDEAPALQAFSFSEIKAATRNFSSENLLGSGGFGPVYKCVFPGGEKMAVKRLSKSSTQGIVEFRNEVLLTARLQHVNLVRVEGFCVENDEKMLVYEFMPNGSLDVYLYDPVKRLGLDWNIRVRIIEGVKEGLLYLQEYSNLTIIHRDLKASNILLDDKMNPKISDFGMAKLFTKDLYEANTKRIVGTFGYIPPEYVKNGIYSMKYDVYSFGVLLLQLISSKRIQRYYGQNEDMHLLDHAYDSWSKGKGLEFCDPSLDDSSSPCKLTTCLHVALLCVQEKHEDRPTMLEVKSIMTNGAVGMADPKRPAYSARKETVSATRFQQEIICSYNDADISSVEAR